MITRVTLRISALDLEPDHVTRALGLAPTTTQRRGETQRFAPDLVHGTGAWLMKSGAGDYEDLRAHLLALCEALEPRREDLLGLLATGADAVVECSVTTRDGALRVALPEGLVARLAALRLAVTIDVGTQ